MFGLDRDMTVGSPTKSDVVILFGVKEIACATRKLLGQIVVHSMPPNASAAIHG
jgi:hypothetical protein